MQLPFVCYLAVQRPIIFIVIMKSEFRNPYQIKHLINPSIYLLMDKLGQVAIENCVNVQVNCQVDQAVLAKNFSTIVDALKELQKAQLLSDEKIKDLLCLKEKVEKLGENSSNSDHSNSKEIKEDSKGSNADISQVSGDLANLAKRVEKNESNIMDNIKDINLINSDMRDVKSDIEELKKLIRDRGESDGNDKENSNGYNINDIASNVSKQLKKNEENMKKLHQRMEKAEENIQKLEEEMKKMKERKQKEGSGGQNVISGVTDQQFEDLKRDLKQKFNIINQKINNLQTDSNQHEKDIAELKNLIKDMEGNGNNVDSEGILADLSELKKRLEEVDCREKDDVKYLQDEINKLKEKVKALKSQKIESKTSLDAEKSNKKSTISKDRDDLSDKLNDLVIKVNYLEKLIAGSKNSLSDERNPEKLPAINKPKRREQAFTVYHEKDKSGIGRKDLAELKAELEVWLRNLLDGMQNKESLESLELKVQEIKRGLEKKADGEGTKKGFQFLENKITQLYLFLTEPDTEDAMIVRKGFNCLSCSKKVEKLRGKLGPKLNWNNMTSTNYSPPRVGYSKPMGDRSIDKEDDL